MCKFGYRLWTVHSCTLHVHHKCKCDNDEYCRFLSNHHTHAVRMQYIHAHWNRIKKKKGDSSREKRWQFSGLRRIYFYSLIVIFWRLRGHIVLFTWHWIKNKHFRVPIPAQNMPFSPIMNLFPRVGEHHSRLLNLANESSVQLLPKVPNDATSDHFILHS